MKKNRFNKIASLLFFLLCLGSCDLPFGLGYINLPWEKKSDSESLSQSEIQTNSFKESLTNSVSDTQTVSNSETITETVSFDENYSMTPVKTAIFADVQLCAKESGTGYSPNAGLTCNAYISLYNHFMLCKEENVDVIFMGGDIVNNAIEKYYQEYKEVLEKVYGTDSSKYPEILWNMGNHEWWNASERDTKEALELFYKYNYIDTKNLVAKSNVKYSLNTDYTIPSYYKVIKGVPYVIISGENSAGKLSSNLLSELKSWLKDIASLESVKQGGPIYISYHIPLHDTLTHGHGASSYATDLERVLKDYPQAIVFTGDTHYSSVNERAINQVDFTTVNIGSSSYSRMDTQSATMKGNEHFYNLEKAGNGAKDVLVGNSNYQYEYTETMMIANVNQDTSSTIDRYFTTDNPKTPVHINKTWNIARGSNKDNFIYTNARFNSKDEANKLYDKDGLSWDINDQVRFGVLNNEMTVLVSDVTDYHYCEYMDIEVTSNLNNTKHYKCVTTYYQYHDTKETLSFQLTDLPAGSSYSVKVTAYDYFDNPSINTLSSNQDDQSACYDLLDYHVSSSYSDISTRVNSEVYSVGNTSIEYYYQGVMQYKYGAILNRTFYKDKPSGNDYVSLKDETGVNIIYKCLVKNPNDFDLVFGIFVVDSNNKWKTDFGKEYQVIVPANSSWTEISWNLTGSFGFTSKSDLGQIGLKASAPDAYKSSGYSFHFYIDDIDIVSDGKAMRGYSFASGKSFTYDFVNKLSPSDTTYEFDLYFTSDSSTKISIMFGNWSSYYGYFDISPNTKTGDIAGLTVTELPDGYKHYSFEIDKITRINNLSTGGTFSGDIKLVYIRDNWNTADGYIDVLGQ